MNERLPEAKSSSSLESRFTGADFDGVNGVSGREPPVVTPSVDPVSVDQQLHWVTIQRSTFTNWVRDRLAAGDEVTGVGGVGGGDATTSAVNDLQTDLCDGWQLCRLVEVLQRRRVSGHAVRRPVNRHQRIDNVNLALKAMLADGIRLINIGNETVSCGTNTAMLSTIPRYVF